MQVWTVSWDSLDAACSADVVQPSGQLNVSAPVATRRATSTTIPVNLVTVLNYNPLVETPARPSREGEANVPTGSTVSCI